MFTRLITEVLSVMATYGKPPKCTNRKQNDRFSSLMWITQLHNSDGMFFSGNIIKWGGEDVKKHIEYVSFYGRKVG